MLLGLVVFAGRDNLPVVAASVLFFKREKDTQREREKERD